MGLYSESKMTIRYPEEVGMPVKLVLHCVPLKLHHRYAAVLGH